MLPNFLIVGAARCGTTALFNILNQHPQISMSELKEPRFFSSKNLVFPHKGKGDDSIDKAVVQTEEEYCRLFSNLNNERVGEASPDYLFYHYFTADNIYKFLGDLNIIIILRNPVYRAYSAYNHLVRDSRETLCFRDALEAEETRKRNNYDFMWLYKEVGLYYNQVKTFMNRFTNVHILLQEDLKKNPQMELEKIASFLSIKRDFQYNSNINYNSAGIPNNLLSRFILNRNNAFSVSIRETLKKILPRNLLENVSGKLITKNEEISTGVRESLENYFADDIRKLEKLIGRDLSKVWY